MDVVRHEHIAVEPTACVAAGFLQPVQVEVEVLLGEEAGLAIDAPLHDMQWEVRKEYSGASRHVHRPEMLNVIDPFHFSPPTG